MRDTDLFQLALGLTAPCYVVSCEFDVAKHRLDIEIEIGEKITSHYAVAA